MLYVISRDNSRSDVFQIEIRAKVALQEDRVRARGRDLGPETPSPGSLPAACALPSSWTLFLLPPGSFQPAQAPSSSSCLHIPSAGISSWVVAAAGRVWTYLPLFDIPHKEVLQVGVPPTLPLLQVWIRPASFHLLPSSARSGSSSAHRAPSDFSGHHLSAAVGRSGPRQISSQAGKASGFLDPIWVPDGKASAFLFLLQPG